jgi:alpha-amylase/alpha-mannosidase (GH57 family)
VEILAMNPSPKLNVAFVWHMHQPEYKDALTGEYLMPWVRLHATKDYLDMVEILAAYPKIKQTFNLVPILIEQLQDYINPNTTDRLLHLMQSQTLTEADKLYILERGFDAHIERMVKLSPRYWDLYTKRATGFESGLASDQDYYDIITLLHLVWFDPMWRESIPELKLLWHKGRDYSWHDRKCIIEIGRSLIERTLSTYQAYQAKGQIEITTTPYYHPILPLLLDSDSARRGQPFASLPEERFCYEEDARYQVSAAKKQYESIFKQAVCGIWPAEQSISPEALKIIEEQGFQWAISSEGNLGKTVGVMPQKDAYGNIENVEIFCQPYRYGNLTLLFRDLTLSDLIGFDYAKMPANEAAQDCYQRLKTLQIRCQNKNVPHPLVTIALDGENCWENYEEDGRVFLNALYTLLSEDDSLNICRVKDYLEAHVDTVSVLNTIHSGSWIDSDFHIWIGDPVKNAAWMQLKRTRDDLISVASHEHHQPDLLSKAWQEIYIAQGSDWFWWYGEPHYSGQDHIFDMQFRRHLSNVYKLLDQDPPNYLSIPLSASLGQPVTPPLFSISPQLSGLAANKQGWHGAGSYENTTGAMHQGSQILKKFRFGADQRALYLRLHLNFNTLLQPNQALVIYFCTPGKTRHNSPMRVIAQTDDLAVTQRYHYAFELTLNDLASLNHNKKPRLRFCEAIPDFLWKERRDVLIATEIVDVIDLEIPFSALNIYALDMVQFSVGVLQDGVMTDIYPVHYPLSVQCLPHQATLKGHSTPFP